MDNPLVVLPVVFALLLGSMIVAIGVDWLRDR